MEKGNWSGLDRGFGYLRMYFEDLRCNDLSILLDMSILFALVLTLELYCSLGKIFELPIMDLLFWYKSNDVMTANACSSLLPRNYHGIQGVKPYYLV